MLPSCYYYSSSADQPFTTTIGIVSSAAAGQYPPPKVGAMLIPPHCTGPPLVPVSPIADHILLRSHIHFTSRIARCHATLPLSPPTPGPHQTYSSICSGSSPNTYAPLARVGGPLKFYGRGRLLNIREIRAQCRPTLHADTPPLAISYTSTP